MKWVYICSPLRSDYYHNQLKAEAYCREAVKEGVLPLAPHIYLTRFLADADPEQRRLGMHMGIEMLKKCQEIWVYGEPSEGMKAEIEMAEKLGIKIVRKAG